MIIGRKQTIFEGSAGMHFHNGKLVDVLTPGVYRFFAPGHHVTVVSTRPVTELIGGQEVSTRDGGTFRVTLLVSHQLIDPAKNFRAGEGPEPDDYPLPPASGGRIHQISQIALRDWAMSRTFREAFDHRDSMVGEILPLIVQSAATIGVQVNKVELLDFVVGGSLRSAMSDLLKAEVEGQAALVRARNEAATMRNLLNTARLVREHPGLLELRVLASGQRPRVTFSVGGMDRGSGIAPDTADSG